MLPIEIERCIRSYLMPKRCDGHYSVCINRICDAHKQNEKDSIEIRSVAHFIWLAKALSKIFKMALQDRGYWDFCRYRPEQRTRCAFCGDTVAVSLLKIHHKSLFCTKEKPL